MFGRFVLRRLVLERLGLHPASKLIEHVGSVEVFVLHGLHPVLGKAHEILDLLLVDFEILKRTRTSLFPVMHKLPPFGRFIVIVLIVLLQLNLDRSGTPLGSHLRTPTALPLPSAARNEALLAVGCFQRTSPHDRPVIHAPEHLLGAPLVQLTGSLRRVIESLSDLLEETRRLVGFFLILFLASAEVYEFFPILAEAVDLRYRRASIRRFYHIVIEAG